MRDASQLLIVYLCVQRSFAFVSKLVWDKSPNVFGQKAICVDPTGVVIDKQDEWLQTAASIGSHLLRLAIAQGIIEQTDLERTKVGVPFKVSELVQTRPEQDAATHQYTPNPQDIDKMCAWLVE